MKLKTECDKLWSECIKARAGYKSEISNKTEKLHSHHIMGKPNLSLRYDLDNGICLTAGEHFFGIHNQGRMFQYLERIKAVIGDDRWQRLQIRRALKTKTLLETKEYLTIKLKQFKEAL